MKSQTCLWVVIALVVIVSYGVDAVEESTQREANRAIDRGLAFLATQQDPDGGWRKTPALTALAVEANLKAPRLLTLEEKGRVERGLQAILQSAHPDGGLYTDSYANYNTSICLMALVHANDPVQYGRAIIKARDFLLGEQFDEKRKVLPNDTRYGGIGYEALKGQPGWDENASERPDLSNTHWALEAIRLAEMTDLTQGQPPKTESNRPESKLHWAKAITFLERCQNYRAQDGKGNPLSWSGTDGGAIYAPDVSKASPGITEKIEKGEDVPAGSLRSYPSMTYALFKSYLYADLAKDDPRVKAAYGWITHNWDLTRNGAMEMQGYYYYLLTLAKALDAWGDEEIVDANHKTHHWRQELAGRLLLLQRDGGYWQNDAGRWEESDKVLATCYALQALEIARRK